MSENPHPALAARERRQHQIRVRIATAAVGLFVALFSVIYAQTSSSANLTSAQKTSSDNNTSPSDDGVFPPDDGAAADQPTPMTSGQS
jgi:hypothetical protein